MAHAVSRLARVAVVGVLVYHIAHLTHDGHADNRADSATADAADSRAEGPGRRIVVEAMAERGVEYSWGGGTTTGKSRGICCSPGGFDGRETVGFDCSGLVLYAAFQATGGRIKLPRTAAEQVQHGIPVTRAQMRPGDLIGFDHRDGQGVTHIGIYIGHGQMVNAPQTGDVVKISSLASRKNQRWTIRRLT